MTQEDKELLLRDLSARFPYDTIVKISNVQSDGSIYEKDWAIDAYVIQAIRDCEFFKKPFYYSAKPYLRPLSSMTEEEKNEFLMICPCIVDANTVYGFDCNDFGQFYKIQEFLLSHHFDYRGLIEKGLALEAPEGMYNLKK